MAMYEAEKGEKAETRVENLKELVTACENFVLDDAEEDMTPLNAFLAHAALEAGEEQADEYQDAVQHDPTQCKRSGISFGVHDGRGRRYVSVAAVNG